MPSELRLVETKHPHKRYQADFDALVGIDTIKATLVEELTLILDRTRADNWHRKHHGAALPILERVRNAAPMIVLAGDVGCGKTALASSVGSPVAKALDQPIVCFETPSDIRGGGHVGELSSRITEAFAQARAKVSAVGRGILVIDEADDLATERSQSQAHHEDRAGVNVLIKQLDQIAKDGTPLAVILITNRLGILDAAVTRRAVLRLEFTRPDDAARAAIFKSVLAPAGASSSEVDDFVAATRTTPPYTYSDLAVRLPRVALRRAIMEDSPFNAAAVLSAVAELIPSPLLHGGGAVATA